METREGTSNLKEYSWDHLESLICAHSGLVSASTWKTGGETQKKGGERLASCSNGRMAREATAALG